MSDTQLIPHLFKTEYRKIISVLCKTFGIAHVEVAEDIVNDAFLLATETWALKGIPENPVAWLYVVAKNKTKDYLKRNENFSKHILPAITYGTSPYEEIELDLSAQNITDSQLQMIFAICHPAISPEAQIGMSLRILCGFGINEIAEAFLTNKETINKRLHRAKEKLRTENIKIELPADTEINKRLETVLSTLYLLFNEGYYSATHNHKLRKDLCLEAMRLCYLLIENENTNKPAVNALLALMCFHSSRFEARANEDGSPILYDDQDRNLWDDGLIAQGNYFLQQSAHGNEISKYHLEASIAYWHSMKIANDKKWEHILQLYNQLLQIEYSPIAALNRTYALAQARNKETAIVEAEKLQLTGSHLYYSLLGNLYTGIDDKKAIANYILALQLAKTNTDKELIHRKLELLGQ